MRPLHRRPPETSRYRRSASSAFPDAAAIRARWTRAWAATNVAWAASAVASACRWSSSALRRSPFARAIAPSPARANAAWSPNPIRPASSNARRYASTAAASPRVLGRPRFEQQHRGAKRVVSDRVRMTAGDRGPRGDGRDVAGVRRTHCANEAARRDAPVVSSRLERGGRVVRHRGSAFDVARLPKGEREHQLRSRAAMVPQRSRQARPRVRRPRARAEIELFGCDVAEVGELLDPQLDRSVIVRGARRARGSAVPRRRGRPARSTSPTCRAEPRRQGRGVASASERSPEIVVFQLQAAFPAQPVRPAQLDAPRRRAAKYSARAAGRRRARRPRRDARARTRGPCRACRWAAPPANEADTIDLSTSAATRYATVASLRPCLAASATSDGDAPPRWTASCWSSLLVPVQEVVAPFHEPLQRGAGRSEAGLHAGAPRAARGWRRAPRDRARSRARRRARSPAAIRRRAGNLGSERDGLGVRLESGSCRARTLEESSTAAASSGATGSLTSLATWSASRLVARIRAWGHSARTVDAIRAASSSTCSHASRTRRAAAVWRNRDVTRASGSEPRTSTACARRRTASSAPPARAKSTSQMPSGNSASRERAASTASRLLPTPGAPVSVTRRRCSCRTPETCASLVLASDERRRWRETTRRLRSTGTAATAGSCARIAS